MKDILAREWRTYEAHKQELLERGSGLFVLIKDDVVIDLFETRKEAIETGYERFGNVAFLAHQILEEEPEEFLFLNLVGP